MLLGRRPQPGLQVPGQVVAEHRVAARPGVPRQLEVGAAVAEDRAPVGAVRLSRVPVGEFSGALGVVARRREIRRRPVDDRALVVRGTQRLHHDQDARAVVDQVVRRHEQGLRVTVAQDVDPQQWTAAQVEGLLPQLSQSLFPTAGLFGLPHRNRGSVRPVQRGTVRGGDDSSTQLRIPGADSLHGPAQPGQVEMPLHLERERDDVRPLLGVALPRDPHGLLVDGQREAFGLVGHANLLSVSSSLSALRSLLPDAVRGRSVMRTNAPGTRWAGTSAAKSSRSRSGLSPDSLV